MIQHDQQEVEKQLEELEALTHDLTKDATGFADTTDRLSHEVNTEYAAAEEELGKLTLWLEEDAKKTTE